MATTLLDSSTGSETFGTTSPVSGSAPSAAIDGQPIAMIDGMTVVVDAGAATTLSGAGTLQAYVYDGRVGAWARWTSGDFSVTGTTRAQAFVVPTMPAQRNARVKWVPNGVTFAAGAAGVTVYQLGHSRNARGVYP